MSKLYVLMATAFVDMLGFAMVFPLLPFYAQELGASPFTIGLLISSFSVAQLATAPRIVLDTPKFFKGIFTDVEMILMMRPYPSFFIEGIKAFAKI